jgi:hypothetical protein
LNAAAGQTVNLVEGDPHPPPRGLYSRKCVEWAFSEVGFPLYGVLGSFVNVTAGRAVYKNADRLEASGWGVATPCSVR